eukprot:TRINITY_DN676_c1_g3_i1.p1 TRINITY_DN676_c1_g3~~TRINITY_DN676_c1_g3_i1.p1  ORF type:complete len:267 (+),score=40.21 TRINITY_DN676_c1_g3_i1:58-801(+)
MARYAEVEEEEPTLAKQKYVESEQAPGWLKSRKIQLGLLAGLLVAALIVLATFFGHSQQASSTMDSAVGLSMGGDSIAIQYLRVKDHNTIKGTVPDCDFWEKADLGKKVDDKCCDLSTWPAGAATQTPPDARTKPGDPTQKWDCYAQERTMAPGTYTRNFFGCEGGTLKAAEGCAPPGTSMGHGYPMNKTMAMLSFQEGDSHICGCEQPGYVGEGCFVAMTGYIKGVSPDPTANFVKLTGDCTAISR